ncbi:MAG: glycosyl hydrolase family 18 [Acidimicrobiales bacterium]|nr:glycosyl hydrolase family 18 [Acidimicrobiales bacterium]
MSSDPIPDPTASPAPADRRLSDMTSTNDSGTTGGKPPKKPRLSVVRSLVALVVVAGAVLGTSQIAVKALQRRASASTTRWFAPYVDVTLPPYLDFQDPATNPTPDVVLAFVVASSKDGCTPSWGGSYGLDEAASQLDLDRRIVRLRQRGGDVLVSFGGVANQELAKACTDPKALAAAYQAVITRYHLTAIDLDLEGGGLDDTAATSRRAAAIAQVQAAERRAGRRLQVWLTLPLAPTGMLPNAVAAIDGMLAAKVDVTGVNVMAMEYGASRPASMSFVAASLSGIDAAAGQVTSAYKRVGVTLTPSASFAKLGVTPMIGQNGGAADRLDTRDARRLFDESSRRGVRRFSMWSLNRDVECGGNIDPAISNNRCSGVAQTPLQFSQIFGEASGRATSTPPTTTVDENGGRASLVTSATPGPHPDWRPRREYETGTKVVWHGQVYVAKWWNKAAQPDASVKHEWDSPWRVLGPVLAHDVPPTTSPPLPAGTYPEWHQGTIYNPGERVQHLGIGYRAKWWTRGEDPAVDVDNEWQSPWAVVGAPTDPTATPPPTTTATPVP